MLWTARVESLGPVSNDSVGDNPNQKDVRMSTKAPRENETSRDEDSAMNMKDEKSTSGSSLGGFDRGAVERHATEARASAREGLQNLRDAASQVGAGIGAAGAQVYDMAREQAGNMREAVQVRAESAYDQTCEWVRQSPVQALLLAAGAGMIVGAFMLRR
jgi:ElaB/YqjD/DUF883 family membrane-anchored ribosome-binding protein